MLSEIDHENVVIVHDAGKADGCEYLIMDFIEGGTAREWQVKENRTLEDILDVYIRAGRGLAAIHRHGVTHRDFKPDNILVSDDGRRVVVADFGLAIRTGQEDCKNATTLDSAEVEVLLAQNETTVMSGTRGYIAPELRDLDANPRSDQYAFCASLWEALTGELPSAAVSDERWTWRSGRTRELPVWLGKTLRRGLQRDPDDRYANMNELLSTVERRKWASHFAREVIRILFIVSVFLTFVCLWG
jgi:serine/threonine protein kinase